MTTVEASRVDEDADGVVPSSSSFSNADIKNATLMNVVEGFIETSSSLTSSSSSSSSSDYNCCSGDPLTEQFMTPVETNQQDKPIAVATETKAESDKNKLSATLSSISTTCWNLILCLFLLQSFFGGSFHTVWRLFQFIISSIALISTTSNCMAILQQQRNMQNNKNNNNNNNSTKSTTTTAPTKSPLSSPSSPLLLFIFLWRWIPQYVGGVIQNKIVTTMGILLLVAATLTSSSTTTTATTSTTTICPVGKNDPYSLQTIATAGTSSSASSAHSLNHHHHYHYNKYWDHPSRDGPPPLLVVMAFLTLLIIIFHPDGITWLLLRKLREGIIALIQIPSTCWSWIVHDYGAVVSSVVALATFASLFFLVYVMHQTLASRTPQTSAAATTGKRRSKNNKEANNNRISTPSSMGTNNAKKKKKRAHNRNNSNSRGNSAPVARNDDVPSASKGSCKQSSSSCFLSSSLSSSSSTSTFPKIMPSDEPLQKQTETNDSNDVLPPLLEDKPLQQFAERQLQENNEYQEEAEVRALGPPSTKSSRSLPSHTVQTSSRPLSQQEQQPRDCCTASDTISLVSVLSDDQSCGSLFSQGSGAQQQPCLEAGAPSTSARPTRTTINDNSSHSHSSRQRKGKTKSSPSSSASSTTNARPSKPTSLWKQQQQNHQSRRGKKNNNNKNDDTAGADNHQNSGTNSPPPPPLPPPSSRWDALKPARATASGKEHHNPSSKQGRRGRSKRSNGGSGGSLPTHHVASVSEITPPASNRHGNNKDVKVMVESKQDEAKQTQQQDALVKRTRHNNNLERQMSPVTESLLSCESGSSNWTPTTSSTNTSSLSCVDPSNNQSSFFSSNDHEQQQASMEEAILLDQIHNNSRKYQSYLLTPLDRNDNNVAGLEPVLLGHYNAKAPVTVPGATLEPHLSNQVLPPCSHGWIDNRSRATMSSTNVPFYPYSEGSNNTFALLGQPPGAIPFQSPPPGLTMPATAMNRLPPVATRTTANSKTTIDYGTSSCSASNAETPPSSTVNHPYLLQTWQLPSYDNNQSSMVNNNAMSPGLSSAASSYSFSPRSSTATLSPRPGFTYAGNEGTASTPDYSVYTSDSDVGNYNYYHHYERKNTNNQRAVSDNPFAPTVPYDDDDDEAQIEAELQELGGQIVGSLLDS